MQPTFVLVLGSHASGRRSTALQRELALRGHRSLAVDLPGHGTAGFSTACEAQDRAAFTEEPSPMAGITHADNVAHVAETVRRVRKHGPVILVGHSRGGFTVTSVANAVPDLLARTVYVSAWCCVTGTATDYLATPAFRSPDTGAEIVAFRSALDTDESRDTGTDLIDPATWGRIPHTYVRLTADTSMPLALQDHFIEEADALTPGNPFDVHSLPVGHIDPLLRPTGLAEILAGTADYSDGA
ncbi:alpha/beta hydrolase [Amycolatopsis circi]|uniref:alpha/beta hydrolase n=1 Tax=Amycolatopsis circi TaxID=871959 RepID=UPI000E239888|nr:alpha/beta hydrolase [Amycolatopsis circi]